MPISIPAHVPVLAKAILAHCDALTHDPHFPAAYLPDLDDIRFSTQVVLELAQAAEAPSAHRMRTPLSGIVGYAELMLDADAFNHNQQRTLQEIYTHGQRLITIIQDFYA